MKKYKIKINAHVDNFPIIVEAENEIEAEEIAWRKCFPNLRKSWDESTNIEEI